MIFDSPKKFSVVCSDRFCGEEIPLLNALRRWRQWHRYYGLLEAAIGNAEIRNIAADLFHVCEAAKYGGYFVTRDRRLLSRASVIRRAIDTEVVNPSEFVAAVEKAKKRVQELRAKGKR
jgi:hypothetical protein